MKISATKQVFFHDQVQILVLESWQILDLVIFLSQIDKVQMHNFNYQQIKAIHFFISFEVSFHFHNTILDFFKHNHMVKLKLLT